jgi:outer membrane protein assembly factor BamB
MKRISLIILTLAVFSALALLHTIHAQDEVVENYWNQFRGANGDGISLATDLPVEFSETKNLRWRIPIHDKGWSSPVVWGDQIWLTTAREDGSELFAVCVGVNSGKIIHDIKVFDVPQPQLEYVDLNSHASPTPIVEAGRVYVHFGTYGTACLDTKSGEKLWERRDLNTDHRVRPASSPIIDGDSLFLTFDGVDVQFIVALDKHTGETVWLQHRAVKSDFDDVLRKGGVTDVEKVKKAKPNDNRKSYATPTIIEHQGRKQLISPAAEVTFSYDPKNGEELWRVRHEGWGWNVACRPIFAHNLVYFTTGVARRLLAVQPDGTGDVTDTHVAWRARRSAPEIPSPLIVDELMFMVTEGGVVTCLEAESGNEVWKGRLRGDYWASPLYADGKIYFFSQEGYVSVISAGREFQLLAENELDERFIASPAIAGNTIIARSLTHLYCLAEGYEMAPKPKIASKPKASKPQKSESKLMSELPLNITGYYMGLTNDDGEFEAAFLIEVLGLDKDAWPTVTFTGEQFRATFANLTQYHRVTLNLAELAKEGKGRGK